MNIFQPFVEYVTNRGVARVLRHRDFRIFETGHWLSTIGLWNFRIALGWLTWQLTESGFWLSVMAFAEAFPAAMLLPFTGAIADRVHRLNLFRATQFLHLALMSTIATLTLTGAINEYLLAGLVFVVGVNTAFGMPARMTLPPNLVPRADISPAVALNSMLFQVSMFLGPALAGLIIPTFGPGGGFVAAALMTVVLLVALYRLRLDHYRDAGARARGGFLADVAEGVKYTAGNAIIAPLMLIVVLAALFLRPYLDFLPGLADHVFGRGAKGLSILVSVAGLAALSASFILANAARTEGLATKVIAGLAVSAVSLFAFALTDAFWPAVGIIVVVGFAMSVTSISSQVLLQNAVEESMRGRVMSLFGINYRGLPAIGSLAMGTASTHIGLQWPIATGAAICLAAWLWAAPRLRRSAPELERMAGI